MLLYLLCVITYTFPNDKGENSWQILLYCYFPPLENKILSENKHSKTLRDNFKKSFIILFWKNIYTI